MTTKKLSLGEAHQLAVECLLKNGCDDSNAKAAADRMIQAEQDLCHSHGLFRLPWYANGAKSGRVNGKAQPKVTKHSHTDGHGDGHSAVWRA